MKLSLERFALIAEIVGGFAVIVSVIYLAYEVRQNTAATRSLTHHEIFDSTLDVNQSIANDADLADIFARSRTGYVELNEAEKFRLFLTFVNYFNMWDAAYTNHQNGLLETDAWNVWDAGMSWYMTEFESAREVWKLSQIFYKGSFQAHVNEILKAVEYLPQ